MKIKNISLALALSVAVLAGCSTTRTKTTVTKSNGDVVVIDEVKTSKNKSAMDALRKAVIVLVTYQLDGGAGVLLGTMAQLNNDKETLKFEKEKFYFEKGARANNNVENI